MYENSDYCTRIGVTECPGEVTHQPSRRALNSSPQKAVRNSLAGLVCLPTMGQQAFTLFCQIQGCFSSPSLVTSIMAQRHHCGSVRLRSRVTFNVGQCVLEIHSFFLLHYRGYSTLISRLPVPIIL